MTNLPCLNACLALMTHTTACVLDLVSEEELLQPVQLVILALVATSLEASNLCILQGV